MAKAHAFKFDDGDPVAFAFSGRVVKRTTEANGDSYLVEYPIGPGRTAAKWLKETDLQIASGPANEP